MYRKMASKKYTITKKIAKHGSQAIIVIPRILEENLKPGTIAEITINVLEEEKWNIRISYRNSNGRKKNERKNRYSYSCAY